MMPGLGTSFSLADCRPGGAHAHVMQERYGEGVNLWRHHVLCLPNGRMALYYNSGTYGKEQLYMKMAEDVCGEG